MEAMSAAAVFTAILFFSGMACAVISRQRMLRKWHAAFHCPRCDKLAGIDNGYDHHKGRVCQECGHYLTGLDKATLKVRRWHKRQWEYRD
jgi:hypothetical protein